MAFAWNHEEEGDGMHEHNAGAGERREHMFDKVVTPSDVGKLNRLVVPKHFAEKYFPLGPASGPAGTVLCFEEGRGGKLWRFRYSYWSSSQSYVMTKGWSRFVREKRLAAGDTVSFCREAGATGGASARFFIGCRRRAVAVPIMSPPSILMPPTQQLVVQVGGGGGRAMAEERVKCLRLFGVNLELHPEPVLPDLQL